MPTQLAQIDRAGMKLLLELLSAAGAKPDIKPARLADQLQDHPDGGNHLATLLAQDILLDESANWAEQLQATLDAICHEELERRFAELTDKAGLKLSAAEKQEFRDLQQQLTDHRAQDGGTF